MFKLSNLSSLQLFQLFRSGSLALVGVCFAQLHVPQTLIGQYETFGMISGMVSFFWVSGIINSMLSVYPAKSHSDKGKLLFNTFLLLSVLSPITGVLLFIFSKNMLAFLSNDGGSPIIKLVVIYLVVSCPAFLVEYILFLNKRNKALVAYGIFSALATLIAAVVPAFLKYPIEYSMYGLIVVAALKWILTIMLLSRFADLKFSKELQTEMLKISLPIILSIFVAGSAEYIDGVIVKSKFDNLFFAVYRYGAKELPILLIVANTLSVAMIPAIAANLDEGLKELKARSTRLMHFFFPLTIILGLTSPFIYRYVLNESFLFSAIIFNIYLLLIIPRVLFPQTILTGMQRTKFLVLSSVLEIIINVSLSLYLAGKIGLAGVAIGTFVAYLFDKLFLMAVAYLYYGVKPSQYVNIRPYFVYVILTLVSSGIGCMIVFRF